MDQLVALVEQWGLTRPGVLLALACICLIQYATHLYYRYRTRAESVQAKEDLRALASELQEMSRDRTAARLENQVLRETLAQPDVDRALTLLLKRFVPTPNDGFAAFLPCDPQHGFSRHTRWLTDESCRKLRFDEALLPQLKSGVPVVLDGSVLMRSRMFGQLEPIDQRKAKRVYVIGVGEGDDLAAALVSTSLLPAPLGETELLQMAKRVMSSLSGKLRQSLQLEQQTDQLRCTREMLELRAIVDGPYDQPLKMMERFLQRLCHQIGAERGSLYVTGRDAIAEPRPLLRCGIQLQPNVAAKWHHHEDSLSSLASRDRAPKVFDRDQLAIVRVETLVGSAVTAPLLNGDRALGVLCLSRRQAAAPTPSQLELVGWAAELLSETFQKIFSYVAIERQARQDGLTDLANRRTFDQQIAREVANVRSGESVEVSLLLLDLDRFKQINDQHGHQTGDDVLRETSKLLKQETAHVRASDRPLLARYGGEELAVVLPGVGVAGASRIAESLRQMIERHPFHNGKRERIAVTASLGVACCPLHADTVDELIAAADAALYQAKSNGRNRVCQAEDVSSASP